jgi:hypothetical protein
VLVREIEKKPIAPNDKNENCSVFCQMIKEKKWVKNMMICTNIAPFKIKQKR